jgi:hypothetical protein
VTPTRSMIEAYDPVWLADAALYWNRAADHLQDTFSQVHVQAQGLGWQGASGDALTAHTFGMHTAAIGVSDAMRGAATIAREGASNLTALASKARYAIEDAQADGFTVGEDLSVSDARSSRNPVEQAARQPQEEPLQTCDGHQVFRDLTGAILGILLTPSATVVGGPLGFLGTMGGAATAIDDLGQCAAP